MKLNSQIYQFDAPTIDVQKESEIVHKSDIAEGLNPSNMSLTHENALRVFLSNVDLFINSSDKSSIDKKELHRIIHDSLDTFDESLADNQIFSQLYVRKIQLEKEIEKMETEKARIDKKVQFKTNLLFGSMFTACFVEFCIGYYCIYQVEWLGWDLVEPFTYSIGQGKFVVGTWFFCKYLWDTNSTDLNDFFNKRFAKKMYRKNGFELERLEYYRSQLEEINNKLQSVELSKIY